MWKWGGYVRLCFLWIRRCEGEGRNQLRELGSASARGQWLCAPSPCDLVHMVKCPRPTKTCLGTQSFFELEARGRGGGEREDKYAGTLQAAIIEGIMQRM